MEIKITTFFHDGEHADFSASRMEMGNDAARITWANAKREAETTVLLPNEDALDAFRAWIKEFGAWDEKEIASWSPVECNALLIQFINGNIRELPTDDDGEIDWDKAERLANEGTIAGNIYRGDDGEIYFYMGN